MSKRTKLHKGKMSDCPKCSGQQPLMGMEAAFKLAFPKGKK